MKKFLFKHSKIIISSSIVGSIITGITVAIASSSDTPWWIKSGQKLLKSNVKCETVVSEKDIPDSNDKEELNIREGPGVQYNKLDTSLKNGTKIIVNKYVDGWVEISEPEKGFVAENRTKARIDCVEIYQ